MNCLYWRIMIFTTKSVNFDNERCFAELINVATTVSNFRSLILDLREKFAAL